MILFNLYNTENVSPVDIIKVISNCNPYSTQDLKDITIYRKLYRQVNTTFICVSTHKRTHYQSFFDRGTIGGVAGDDVTVINTPPHRNVNILGIDDHNITSVPIAIGGALDDSQASPVIIIMHQYEYNRKGKTIHYYV